MLTAEVQLPDWLSLRMAMCFAHACRKWTSEKDENKQATWTASCKYLQQLVNKKGSGLLKDIAEHIPYPNVQHAKDHLKLILDEYKVLSPACEAFCKYFDRTWTKFRIGFLHAFSPPGFPKSSNAVESSNSKNKLEDKRAITSVPRVRHPRARPHSFTGTG